MGLSQAVMFFSVMMEIAGWQITCRYVWSGSSICTWQRYVECSDWFLCHSRWKNDKWKLSPFIAFINLDNRQRLKWMFIWTSQSLKRHLEQHTI